MRPLIIFFGPNAAGKKTQARILCRKLAKQYGWGSLRTIVFRSKHGLLAFLPFLGHRAKEKRIYGPLELVNLLPGYLLRCTLNRRMGRLVVARHFVQDSLSFLAHYTQRPDVLQTPMGRIYLGLIPRDAVSVFLYAPHWALRERRLRSGRHAQSMQFVDCQTSIGRQLVGRDTLAVDTSKHSADETAQIIESYMKRKGILS